MDLEDNSTVYDKGIGSYVVIVLLQGPTHNYFTLQVRYGGHFNMCNIDKDDYCGL